MGRYHMLYVPILKNRTEEMRFLRDYNSFFSDQIIPLVEVISEIYKPNYLIDEKTGNCVYEIKQGNVKHTKVKLPDIEENIITLPHLISIVGGKKIFVDFFRFIDEEYDIQIDFSKIDLAVRNSRFFKIYKKHVLELCGYSNVIPIISIKNGLEMNESALETMVSGIKLLDRQVGIRITSGLFEKYSNVLKRILSSDDYILFDIREENMDSQFMELEDFQEFKTYAKKVLLNSPRKCEYRNTAYEESGLTSLINNNVAKSYSEYGFTGYGDFAGLKDTLPRKMEGSKFGAALSLLYDYKINKF